MDARSITCRPSLPLGFKVGDLPRVQRPLYTDEAIEVYLLDRGTDSDLVLFRSRDQRTATDLREWWRIMGSDIVTEVWRDAHADALSAVRLRGQWWPDTRIAGIAESQWNSILLASTKLLRAACNAGFYPYLKPSLIWMSQEALTLVPVLAEPRPAVLAQELLGDLAAFYISSSTGSEVAEVADGSHKLRSWNRYIPSNLFDALIRCLPSRGAVSSFDEFERLLTGESVISPVQPPQVLAAKQNGGLRNVAGMQDLKEWLRKEVLGPLQNPEIYEKYRIGVPNGILFYGPPGCGKTYIARAVAEELGYFFEEIKPSDLASPYIHSTVLRIRELFETAVEKAPAVLFIDEFEAFVPPRSELGAHQQYKAEEVNEFLANLEGLGRHKVLLIAATNEPNKIDPAVRRSGRFDKLVFIPPPDAKARAAMLEYHLAGRPLEERLDLSGLAAVLDGYSASDTKLLVEEAAHLALDRAALISTEILLSAIGRVPASITPEDVARYSAFCRRGI